MFRTANRRGNIHWRLGLNCLTENHGEMKGIIQMTILEPLVHFYERLGDVAGIIASRFLCSFVHLASLRMELFFSFSHVSAFVKANA